MRRRALVGAALAAAAIAGGCQGRGPQPIAYGSESCDACRMTITEPRFAAQVVTSTGRARKFDSIECLAGYVLEARAAGEGSGVEAWVTDYRKPGTFVPADNAVYLGGGGAHSPMGLRLMAFPAGTDTAALVREFGGAPLAWNDVLALVERERARPGEEGEGGASPHAHADVGGDDTPGTLVVSPDGALSTIAAAVSRAAPGGGTRIVVRPGIYREPEIVIDRPVEIVGEPGAGAVLDGEGAHQLITVKANGVTIRGLTLRNVGTSYVEDRAAIRVAGVGDCVVSDNRIERSFFGIYLAGVDGCRVERNVVSGAGGGEAGSGNGIHLWSSRRVTVADNRITGQRDGIYFEFVHDSEVRGNTSEGNLRYGLHFMFSDSCRYLRNVFRKNQAGVAVMYTKQVEMIGNRFEENWGAASYGLLLKEVHDARLAANRFHRNTVGLFSDGADRIHAEHNDFTDNGWAVKLLASTQDGRFERNNFGGNTFDVATNSRGASTTFTGNHWSDYRGYDLDRDGVGDVPYHPVRLFSLIVEQNAPTTILLRGLFVDLIDAAERVVPSLTPETLVDARPAMSRIP